MSGSGWAAVRTTGLLGLAWLALSAAVGAQSTPTTYVGPPPGTVAAPPADRPAKPVMPLDLAPKPARPAAAPATETVLVPDKFLRRWDPVTIFFAGELGPAGGGAEDRPERVVAMSPLHAGAFTWLDPRTLQFQPAEPWPALARFTFTVGSRSFRLSTLLSPPVRTEPPADAEGLPPIEQIAFTFNEPLPAEALAQVVAIETRPLPGLGGAGARLLARDDYEIKTVERGRSADPAKYVFVLRQPIGLGQKVTVRFRLSLDEPAERAFAELAFATAEPFRAARFGCRQQQLPVVPGGARYSAEQALSCESDDPAVVVDFTALPKSDLGAVEARNLVRISPAVPKLAATMSGKRLELRGEFARDSAYRVTLAPTAIADRDGRPLDLAAPNELRLSFPRAVPYLHLAAASGLAERRGPQMVPLAGRGDERVDLRIHRIDPLDLAFWPFPTSPVVLDEGRRPPGPGERPKTWTGGSSNADPSKINRYLAALGTPSISALVDLPLRRDGSSATFGLDLAPHLAKLSGAGAAGTYLVGLRRLGGAETREWMRLQVSDLALTTLEEPLRVVFVVTSLAAARAVTGAEVRVEGERWIGGKSEWVELFRGTTDGEGHAVWVAPGSIEGETTYPKRIVVRAGDDHLVLDAQKAPDGFADNRWSESYRAWLQWTQEGLQSRGAQPVTREPGQCGEKPTKSLNRHSALMG